MESFLFFYDPSLLGYLESIEVEVEKILTKMILQGDVYYIILVLSRVRTIDRDHDLRFKA